jgi:hypothetical protein
MVILVEVSWKNRDSGAVEKPFFKEIFSINIPSLDGSRGLRGG